MPESILTSIKAQHGLVEAQTAFDDELILLINGVFADLQQMGVGPDAGFAITSKEDSWEDFLPTVVKEDLTEGPDPRLNSVKPFVAMKVKLVFDPPDVGLIPSYEKLIDQAAWRITVASDEIKRPYVPPAEVVEEPVL